MSPIGRAAVLVPVALAVAFVGAVAAAELGEGREPPRSPPPRSRLSMPPRTPAGRPSPSVPRPGWREILLGRSVRGRPIVAETIGVAAPRGVTLVVGCIHGNECAGIAIARDLVDDAPPRHRDVWVIPDLNPDGRWAGTRQNADGVDLNRNFPWRWRPLGRRGELQYSGPGPLSEPESREARRLILRIRPAISIWFHQDEDLVDESGGRISVERRYAHLVGLPLRRLPRFPGSVVGWENHRLPGTTAFVVELPPGPLSAAQVERYSDAIVDLS